MMTIHSRLLVLVLLAAIRADAQTARRLGIEADNDFFVTFDPYSATDYEYTHGTRIWLESPAFDFLPRVFPGMIRCSEASACRHRITIGQDIYTPRREAVVPIEGERPHAAWLYASLETNGYDAHATTAVRIGLGVLGPPALGEEMQTVVHRWLDFRTPRGWDHQLPFEPTVQVGITRTAQLFGVDDDVVSATTGYDLAADLGNVLAQVQADIVAMVCVGSITCSLTHGGAGYGFSARGKAGSRLVLRNTFLDGTLRESRSVEKEYWVPNAAAAFAIHLRRFLLRYNTFAVRLVRMEKLTIYHPAALRVSECLEID
jgi:hypothetical protein